MRVVIQPTDIPGLFNVFEEDGRVFTDITVGQVRYLASEREWEFPQPAPIVNG